MHPPKAIHGPLRLAMQAGHPALSTCEIAALITGLHGAVDSGMMHERR
jgi:hypothetical protein